MTFDNKNILIVSPEPWEHIFVSKHHYARTLAIMGANVIFANPPKQAWEIKETDYKNLRVLNYPKFIKGLGKLPFFFSRRLIKNKFQQIEEKCKLNFDIIWSFDNSVFFDFKLLRSTFNISHIVDLDQDFELERAAQTADLCLYVTSQIGKKLKPYNTSCHFINHGYNQQKISREENLPGHNKLKVFYAGNLNMKKLDWSTLFNVVVDNKNIDFIFAGPLDENREDGNETSTNRPDILRQKNVYLLGQVPSDELVNYYNSADVLLLCYQEKYHEDQSNSHKLMEYLGTGKPILASHTKEFEKYKEREILMSSWNNEMPQLLKKLCNDYSFYNSNDLITNRKNIALENTYPNQISKVEKIVSDA